MSQCIENKYLTQDIAIRCLLSQQRVRMKMHAIYLSIMEDRSGTLLWAAGRIERTSICFADIVSREGGVVSLRDH